MTIDDCDFKLMMEYIPKPIKRANNLCDEDDTTSSLIEVVKKPLKQVANGVEAALDKCEKLGFVCIPLTDKEKRPKNKGWEKTTKTNRSEFKNADHYGIVCGKASGITVVDIDDCDKFEEIINLYSGEYEKDYFNIEDTFTVKTASGGLHYYFKYEKGIPSASNMIKIENKSKSELSCVDVRNDGGQTVGFGSKYYSNKPNKKQYEGGSYSIINDKPILAMPEFLKKLLLQKVTLKRVKGELMINEPEDSDEESEEDEEEDEEANVDESETTEVKNNNKLKLTFDQVKKIINALPTEQFGDYSTWFKLIIGYARWCDENDIEDKVAISFINKYCKECPNYDKVNGIKEVRAKYYEASKAKNSKKFSFGSIIYWLKEQKPEKYKTIFKNILKEKEKDKLKEEIENTDEFKDFDKNDEYDWIAFEAQFRNMVFDDYQEIKKLINKHAARVICKNISGDGMYIKKTSKDQLYDFFRAWTNLKFDLIYDNGKTTKLVSIEKLIDFKNYSEIVIDPTNSNKKNTLNIWQPYYASELPINTNKVEIQGILDLLMEVFAANDRVCYEYVLDWLAHTIQKPEQQTQSAIIIFGDEGLGKNTFTNFFRKYVIGNHLTQEVGGIEGVVGHFNGYLLGKKLVIMNELQSDSYKKDTTLLKNYIDGEIIRLENKNKDIMFVNNILNYIGFTNEKFPIPITKKSRRYYIQTAGKKWEGNKKHFAEFRKKYYNDEVGRAFYDFLMNRKYDFESVLNPPKTKTFYKIAGVTVDCVSKFINHIEDCKEYNAEDHEDDDEEVPYNDNYTAGMEIKFTDLYNRYTAWCNQNNEKPQSGARFQTEIAEKYPSRRKKSGMFYTL